MKVRIINTCDILFGCDLEVISRPMDIGYILRTPGGHEWFYGDTEVEPIQDVQEESRVHAAGEFDRTKADFFNEN